MTDAPMRILALALVVVACSKATPKENAENVPDAPSTTAALIASSAPPVASAAPAPTAPSARKYARVLHTGDSMVGGGLARALGPMFEAEGVTYRRDVIESGTIHDFAQNDHLPTLLKSFKPDLILLTLGANHLPNSVDPGKEIGPFIPKLLQRVKGIDCYWIAPPIWKPSQAKFNQWLGEHVAPCRFYDGSALEITRRPDKIHPDEKGGEVWAMGLWTFLKGEGAFPELSPTKPTTP